MRRERGTKLGDGESNSGKQNGIKIGEYVKL